MSGRALRLRIGLSAAAALSSALVLAACGGDFTREAVARPFTTADRVEDTYAGLSPQEILDRVEETTDQARSVRIRATYLELPDGDVRYDMRLNRAGRARGTSVDAGGTAKILIVGPDRYVQPPKDVIAILADGDDAFVEHLTGRWVKLAENGSLTESFAFLEMSAFIHDIVDLTLVSDDLMVVKGREYAGRRTIGIKVRDVPGTLYVAADGSGELVAYKHPEVRAVFSDWNRKLKITAPVDPLFEEDVFEPESTPQTVVFKAARDS